MEEWRDIPGYEGRYQVSSIGSVRSLAWTVLVKRGTQLVQKAKKGRVLRQTSSPRGYPCVSLFLDGARRTGNVHHLVASAFIGPRPSGMFVLHANDKKDDNRVENLRYGTAKENYEDMAANGKASHRGLRPENGRERRKLTAVQVETVRSRRMTLAEMSLLWGVSVSTLRRIRLGRRYKDAA